MKNCFLLSALVWVSAAHSQITYEKGYFINNSGVRTDCYIENIAWNKNPTSFNYKQNDSDRESKVENISGVSEFGIANESLYKRFTVKIERSQIATAYLQQNNIPQFTTETIFLLALVTGEASLYSYSDGNVKKFFYKTNSTPIEQLVMIRYNSNDQISQNNLFRQQLYNNVRCSKTPDTEFENLSYNIKSLSQHFDQYNSCSGNTVGNINYTALEKDHKLFAFRFTPGVYVASAKLEDPDDYYDASVKINQVVLKIGVEAEFYLPFNKNTISLFVSPSYQNFSPEKQYTSYVKNSGFFNDGEAVNYIATISYSTIEIPIGMRYYFYFNNSSNLFIDAAYVITLSTSDETIALINQNGLINADAMLPIADKNNFAFGIGFSYKCFTAALKYHAPRIISEAGSWSAKYTACGLNLGYRIF